MASFFCRLFSCASLPLGARPFHQELDVLLDQLLEALMLGEVDLESGHLRGRHIAGDIAAVFVALMIFLIRKSRLVQG